MLNRKATYFCGSSAGQWRVHEFNTISGQSLAKVSHVDISDHGRPSSVCSWTLLGVASHARYTTREEKTNLSNAQAPLGRPEATSSALILIKKSDDWWSLTQDERREIFESKSMHISRSMKVLPAVARKLYHCRDLDQPFDFVTWFEFSPNQASVFNDLLAELRSTEEWTFVSREIDIRLSI